MIDTRRIETTPGMVFDASVAGSDDAPLVLMLHGFGVSRHFWNAQVPALAKAGFFAVAPNQRGYARDARPDPADHAGYRIELLHRPGTGDSASPGPKPAHPAAAALRAGFGHVAFDVPDLDGAFNHAVARGARPVMPPCPAPEPETAEAWPAGPGARRTPRRRPDRCPPSGSCCGSAAAGRRRRR